MAIDRRDFLKGATALLALAGTTSTAVGAGGLSFLVLGDWGASASHKVQVAVAKAMGKIGAEHDIGFVISTGDNFYGSGVDSTADVRWRATFEKVYTAPSLQVPWYPVLGNHDYGGSIKAQIDYSKQSKRWTMPSRYYAQSKGFGASKADFFFLDTQVLKAPRWTDVLFRQGAERQLRWLEQSLAASQAKWKIVVGHHPVYSGGQHGDNAVLEQRLKPLFDRYGVHAYLSGHDHDLEALRSEKVTYFISGSGSQSRPVHPHPKRLFATPEPGFLLVDLTANEASVSFYNSDAARLHTLALLP